MKNRTLGVLFFIIFLDLLGFGIIIPILPSLLSVHHFKTSFLGSIHPLLTKEYILYGLLVAIYPLLQFFSSPILGQLSDRYGRKKLLIACLGTTALSYGMAVFGIRTNSIELLLLGRAVGGLMGGNIAIAQATAADVTSERDRTRVYGLLGAGFGIGFILGPYIGGRLSDTTLNPLFGIDTPFIAAAALSIVATIVTALLLSETHEKSRRSSSFHVLQSLEDIGAAFGHTRLRALFVIGFLYQFAFTMFVSFFGVILFKQYHFNQNATGEYFAYTGLWIAATQIIFTRVVASLLGNKRMVAVSLVLCAVLSLAFSQSLPIVTLYAGTAVFAIANGLSQTGILSLLSVNGDKRSYGKILGLNASLSALAQSIPPAISGIIATIYSIQAPLLVAATLMAGAFVYLLQKFNTIHD